MTLFLHATSANSLLNLENSKGLVVDAQQEDVMKWIDDCTHWRRGDNDILSGGESESDGGKRRLPISSVVWIR